MWGWWCLGEVYLSEKGWAMGPLLVCNLVVVGSGNNLFMRGKRDEVEEPSSIR